MASFSGFAIKSRGKKRSAPSDLDRDAAKRKAASLLGAPEEGPHGAQSSGTRPAGSAGEPFVIPKQADTFMPGQGDRRFNSERYLPERPEDEVDVEGGADAMAKKFCAEENKGKVEGAENKAAYGLEVRRGRREGSAGEAPSPAPRLAPAGRTGGASNEDDDFRNEVQRLPEALGADSERYVSMPVEEFGKAMMRGMGWQEGKGVGRNAKEDVKVVEFLSRPDRLGLGAQPKAPEAKKPNWINKPGEDGKRKAKVLMAAAGDASGRVRHTRHLDEEMVEYKGRGPREGKAMVVVAGKHEGLRCQVLEILPRKSGRSEYARVRLSASEKVVEVRTRELGEIGEGAAPASKGKGKAPQSSSSSGTGRRGGKPWLHEGLRVRVVDKRLNGGRAYLKKAVVLDVTEPKKCDVLLDEGSKRLNGVEQSALETVVPKAKGTKLLAVRGGSRGRVCSLVQRSAAEGKATVQFLQDLSFGEMGLDDICEYTGQEEEDILLS